MTKKTLYASTNNPAVQVYTVGPGLHKIRFRSTMNGRETVVSARLDDWNLRALVARLRQHAAARASDMRALASRMDADCGNVP